MSALTYGKIFQTMFTGSLCGAGAPVISVMSFVIAFMQPDEQRVEHVRLPVTYLAKVIGEKEEVIAEAIEFLCRPDKHSNSPEDGGARLVLEGAFTYRVVNGQYYRELKDEEDRRRKDAVRAARYRERKKQGAEANGETVRPARQTRLPSPNIAGAAAKLVQTHGEAAAEALSDHMAREHAANVAELNREPAPVIVKPFREGV